MNLVVGSDSKDKEKNKGRKRRYKSFLEYQLLEADQ